MTDIMMKRKNHCLFIYLYKAAIQLESATKPADSQSREFVIKLGTSD